MHPAQDGLKAEPSEVTLGIGDSKVLSVTVAKKSLWIKPIGGDVQVLRGA